MTLVGPALLPDGDPPDDGLEFADRVARARDFYRRFGWPNDRVAVHLAGIDFDKAVHEVGLLPGTGVKLARGQYATVEKTDRTATEPIPALQMSWTSVEGIRLFIPTPFLRALQPAIPPCEAKFESIRGDFREQLAEAIRATGDSRREVFEELRRLERGEVPVLTLGIRAVRECEGVDDDYAFRLEAIHGFVLRRARSLFSSAAVL